ncbi:transposase [Patescibacteria group bacterium]|nr:transposase [Patescibacteria group bacterium]MBU1457914.1 transposase [Patescibacteria group bacterium]
MPSKYYQRNFQPGHFYHIFNRGSHKQNVFLDKQDHQVFTKILSYYLIDPTGRPLHYTKRTKYVVPNHEQTVYLTTYCLMPNHFHLLLKQVSPTSQDGITNLMRRVSIAYSMYFNNKHNHSGNLFQGKYKQVHIETDEQLLYLSKYIHLNPNKRGSEPLQNYQYSSYPVFIDQSPTPKWLHSEEILKLDYYKNSKNPQKDYQKFILDSKPLLKSISPLTLE